MVEASGPVIRRLRARGRRGAWVLLLLACVLPASFGEEPHDVGDSSAAAARIQEELAAARFTEAEVLAREHLSSVEGKHGSRSLEYAQALDLLVASLLGGGMALEDETDRLARGAVDLKERLTPDGSAELAHSLVLLGRLHYDRGDGKTAIEILRRALAMQEASVKPDDASLIHTLRTLGTALLGEGDLTGTEEVFRREGELIALHRGEIHKDTAGHAYNTARFMIEIGDWEQAELLYRKTERIVEELYGRESPLMAYALLGVGNVQAFLGETTDAIETHEEAVKVARKAFRPDHPIVASCYTGLGYALHAVGDLEGAKKTFSDAKELAEREYGPEHEATGRALRLLAMVEREAGDLQHAEEHVLRARQILANSGNEVPGLEATVEYAKLLANRNQLDRAVTEMRAVHETTSESFADHPDAPLWDVALADLLLQANRPGEARELLQEVIGRFPEQLGQDHFVYVDAHAHLAAAFSQEGENGEALELAARTEMLGTERARLLLTGLSERRALTLTESRTSTRDLLLTLATARRDPSAVTSAWDAIVRSRGAVLDELARRNSAVTEMADTAAAEEFVLASRRLANLLVHGHSGDIAAFERSVAEARRRREAAERQLARESRSFRRFQEDRAIGLDEVRDQVPEGSAVVAYVAYRHMNLKAGPSEGRRDYAAFVLPGTDAPKLVRLGPADVIEDSVSATRRRVREGLVSANSEKEAAYRVQAAELRQLVWDPIEKACGKAKRVLIVPEGVLHLISFAALPTGEDRYLIDSGWTFHYFSAEREIASRPAEADGRGLLALGGPDFNARPDAPSNRNEVTSKPALGMATIGAGDAMGVFRGSTSQCPDFQNLLFPRLRHAKSEVRSVARRWAAAHPGPDASPVLVLTGANATEQRFKREAAGRRVLHLSTHGFFLDGQCPGATFGGRGVGGLSTAGKPRESSDGENPLVLSGLVLAGANHRAEVGDDAEDGILTAEEIAALDLTGAEWVVLSACDTGLGQIRPGEGVFGLRRAFNVSGARSLIMTLWPVRDDVAATWMDELYAARLERGADTTASVNDATRKVLERRRESKLSTHPAVWGAFVASGDWR